MRVLRKAVLIVLCLTSSATFSGPALAQDSSARSDDWQFRLAPYAWATAINGDTGFRGVTSDVNMSVGDVLQDVEGALMATFEVKKGPWSLTNDLIWASVSQSDSTPRGVLFSDAKLNVDDIIWTEALGYSLIDCEGYSMDLLGGFRLFSTDMDLKLNGAALESRDISRDETWIDPIVGLRGVAPLTDSTYLRLMGDIGGFDASSTLTWQALAAFAWRFSEQGSIGAGYRALGYDHNRNNFTYDVIMHGPMIGLEYTF